MATFTSELVSSIEKVRLGIGHLKSLLALLEEKRREQASATSAPVVEESEHAAAAAAATAPVEIPEYAKPNFAKLTPNQQHFVLAVINKVRKNDGINIAEITNQNKSGIPFPKEDFPDKENPGQFMKFSQVISTYTTLIRGGVNDHNIFLPEEKPAKKVTVQKAKKATVRTLKTVVEFNNDFAKAIEAVREDKYGEGWTNIVPADAPLEVSIADVLDQFIDLTQYAIDDESNPCASLNESRFLINEGMVSIIPADV